MSTIKKPTALVTGCTPGGLGFELVKAFEARGFHVFATARSPDKILASSSTIDTNIETFPLDVVSSESIANCLSHVQKRTGGRLDVLVNNAGTFMMGPLVHASMDEARKVYDVNVFGMLAVSQAFTPLLARAQGVILNISSLAGAVTMAWQGMYNSSKAAMTCISETLRLELAPVGVRVVTAMVGEMATQIYSHGGGGGGADYSPSLPEGSWYKPVEDILRTQGQGQFQVNNEDPRVTARNLVTDTLGGKRGKIWRGGNAGFASVASWLLPGRVFERMLHNDRGIYNENIKKEAAQNLRSVR
ncbi:putative short-chain dehydrogenase/reductase [Hypoxylon trugodes]|uniref:putative short-chain dehydrogenase/reductase n=1 Tax=Hypoxylon trugodes TaxID=326681 RepID=UPI0021A1ED2A|nr:putative short-chain dehydrogenase/reductase [Hypoxylon trugodes]KAI1389068.1 putative short-chain dehydrogenase/reductase [Hypoxylon trugodes]